MGDAVAAAADGCAIVGTAVVAAWLGEVGTTLGTGLSVKLPRCPHAANTSMPTITIDTRRFILLSSKIQCRTLIIEYNLRKLNLQSFIFNARFAAAVTPTTQPQARSTRAASRLK
jgi:hypothetical protein